jgi:hypothetical protein
MMSPGIFDRYAVMRALKMRRTRKVWTDLAIPVRSDTFATMWRLQMKIAFELFALASAR